MTEQLPLCACGCGKPVNNIRNKYIDGHHFRNKKHKQETRKLMSERQEEIRLSPKPEPKLCKCGCGELTKPGKDYINGHQNRGRKRTQEMILAMSERQKANPSCGMLGKHHSQETLIKLSETGISRNITGDCIIGHHVSYDFLRPEVLIVKVTRKFHSQIHHPKGIKLGKRGYSLID